MALSQAEKSKRHRERRKKHIERLIQAVRDTVACLEDALVDRPLRLENSRVVLEKRVNEHPPKA